MWGLKALQGISEIGASTYDDVVDAYLLYNAGKKTISQWKEVWQEIADSAAKTDSKEANELSRSIYAILSQIEAAEDEMLEALAAKGIQSGACLLYTSQLFRWIPLL